MPLISYITPDGAVESLKARNGDSVMETAVKEGVPGIIAECGGAGACATCHVYVDANFAELVGPPNDLEDDLLDGASSPRKPTSRLSCQIEVRPDLDGLVVEIAPEQL